MKKKILLLLLALALCLGCVGCASTPDENIGENVSNEGTGTTLPIADASQEDFEYSYILSGGSGNNTCKRGGSVKITGKVTNVSGEIFTYMGTGNLEIRMTLYCETDNGRYEMPHDPIPSPEAQPERCEFIPEATDSFTYYFNNVPKDAPLGSYHLKVIAAGFSQTFENVLTIVE